MSFSAEWLALREPIDHAARNQEILSSICNFLATKEPARLIDIGCGTGSTIRAVERAFTQKIDWHLVDYDANLLDVARKESKNSNVTTHQLDLATNPEAALQPTCDLVTTSAFLDLVSEEWLSRFVALLKEKKLPFYASLTYDGRAAALPPLPEDEIILNAFNAHQRTDKGFGDALGPKAAEAAIDLFVDAGFQLSHGLSDWQAGNTQTAFQKELLRGWHQAACEIRPDLKSDFDHWLTSRIALLNDPTNHNPSAFVGHIDLFALPAE